MMLGRTDEIVISNVRGLFIVILQKYVSANIITVKKTESK